MPTSISTIHASVAADGEATATPTSDDSSDASEDESKLSADIIAGAVVGSLVGARILGAVIMVVVRIMRKRLKDDETSKSGKFLRFLGLHRSAPYTLTDPEGKYVTTRVQTHEHTPPRDPIEVSAGPDGQQRTQLDLLELDGQGRVAELSGGEQS